VPTSPLLAVVHIQRTGGTTIENLMVRHFGDSHRKIGWKGGWDDVVAQVQAAGADPAIRSIRGHFPFALRRLLPAGTRFATFVRDPVRRVVSHYDLFQQHPGAAAIYALPKVPQGLPLEEAVGSGAYFLDNVMTRMLSDAPSPFVEPTREHLEQAVRNLEAFDVVGVTERFEQSLVLFQHTFDLPPMLQPRANATARPGAKATPEPTAALIRERNALDLELYDAACARFDRLVAAASADPEFELAVEAFRLAARGMPPQANGNRDATVAIRALALQTDLALYEQSRESARLRTKLERLERKTQKLERRGPKGRTRAFLARLAARRS
jgi:hypothetical protein